LLQHCQIPVPVVESNDGGVMRSLNNSFAAGPKSRDNKIAELHNVAPLRFQRAHGLTTPNIISVSPESAKITRASGSNRPQGLVRQRETLSVACLLTDPISGKIGDTLPEGRPIC
jgi:hypothetical protein